MESSGGNLIQTEYVSGTKRIACIKVFSCCQGHAIYCLWRG